MHGPRCDAEALEILAGGLHATQAGRLDYLCRKPGEPRAYCCGRNGHAEVSSLVQERLQRKWGRAWKSLSGSAPLISVSRIYAIQNGSPLRQQLLDGSAGSDAALGEAYGMADAGDSRGVLNLEAVAHDVAGYV